MTIDDHDIYVSVDDLPKVLSSILGTTALVSQQSIKDASLIMRAFLPGLQSGYFILKVIIILIIIIIIISIFMIFDVYRK